MQIGTRGLAWSGRLAALSVALCASTAWAARLPQTTGQGTVPETQSSAKDEHKEKMKREKSIDDQDQKPIRSSAHGVRGLAADFLSDQKQIWTSPAKIRLSDAQWLLPLGAISAGLFATDRDFSTHLSKNPATMSHYNTLSNAGLAALVGGAGGMWALGHVSHNDHWSETGFLAGEAALNSFVIVEALKYSLRRERPFQGNGSGPFFQTGGTSFPSEHAAAAWSVAGVIAHEYPGPISKIAAYGLASLVDFSRIHARQHFPSDVFVGSVLGNLIAQDIYSRHHDPELGGEAWRSIGQVFRGDGNHSPANLGSPYVPLDSWVYPDLDRLSSMGLIDSGFAGARPWTRQECARLLNEAGEKIDEESTGGTQAEKLYSLLLTEFNDELEAANAARDFSWRVESVYSRVTGISGKPLTDGYHFGQTIINDFGRPYQEGLNTVDGFSIWTSSGRWVAYVRAEYQHAPSAPALSDSARQTIAAVDFIPVVPPATPFAAVNRMQLLDAYVGMNFENWQFTFGKQSLWWGAGEGGPMLFSDDAEPINMFRINRVSPWLLPGFLRRLGPGKAEFFVGRLDGHHFVDTSSGITGSWSRPLNPQPFIDGMKLSLKPTPNLELGFSYMTIFGGVGVPATPRTFLQSFYDGGGDLPNGTSKSSRESRLDFSYRIPKLRKWLTLYGDGFAHDQIVFFIDPKARPLPFGYPDRAAWRVGIYVPQLPKLPQIDFRAEGGYTNNPLGPRGGYDQGFYYAANRYLNGDTNDGNLLGNWIGRAGQGVQVWTNYWFSPRNRIQLNFRHLNVGQKYIHGGGSQADAGVRGDYWVRPSVSFSAWVQYERWLFPVIQPNVSRNVSVAVQVSFQPQKVFQRPAPDSPAGTGSQP